MSFLSLRKMVWRVTRFVGFISSFSQVGFPGKRQRSACRALIREASWDPQLWTGGKRSRVELREKWICEAAQYQPQLMPAGALGDAALGAWCTGRSGVAVSPASGSAGAGGLSEWPQVVASSAQPISIRHWIGAASPGRRYFGQRRLFQPRKSPHPPEGRLLGTVFQQHPAEWEYVLNF